MNNNETCIHGGVSPISLLRELHHSQAKSGRHRCPTCAYEHGFHLGSSGNWKSYEQYCNVLADAEVCQLGSIAPTHVLINLGENQGGTGRHKCTNCAFKQGFEVGVLEGDFQDSTVEVVTAPGIEDKLVNTIITPSSIDFIEKERRNKHLGLLGELFVLQCEFDFLRANGKIDLAARIKHVSVQNGDGLGYDILSFDLLGKEKRIEVKTTRGDISRPFYLTRNELEVSARNSENYFLYRVFDFDSGLKRGKYYEIAGDLTKALNLYPQVFIAYPKPRNKS